MKAFLIGAVVASTLCYATAGDYSLHTFKKQQLTDNPGLQAKALFVWLQGEYPGQFQNGQLRTFQEAKAAMWVY